MRVQEQRKAVKNIMDTLANPSIFIENKKIVELGIGIKDESSFGAGFLRL